MRRLAVEGKGEIVLRGATQAGFALTIIGMRKGRQESGDKEERDARFQIPF